MTIHTLYSQIRKNAGVDYSKAVVINNDNYIVKNRKVFLRPNEYNKLKGKDFIIRKQFLAYIELYKQAKIDENLAIIKGLL